MTFIKDLYGIVNSQTFSLLTKTLSSFGRDVTTTLRYTQISQQTQVGKARCTRWIAGMIKKQLYELKNVSWFYFFFIKNFKEGIYNVHS